MEEITSGTGGNQNGKVDDDIDRKNKVPFFIGVAGGTSSGKFSVCQKIMEGLGQARVSDNLRKVVCISQDSFYKQLAGKLTPTNNYDHPNALDQDLLLQTLQDLLDGKITQVQQYDYITNAPKSGEFDTIYPADVVLFEGILAFYFPEVRALFNMKLFVDTDADTRLYRRVMRDVETRGRDLEIVLNHYMDFVKPSFEEFCLPTKKFADVIIPRGADNTVAISLIVQHIQEVMNVRNGALSNEQSQPVTPSRPANKRQLKKELSRPH